jgi:hypothetical protein
MSIGIQVCLLNLVSELAMDCGVKTVFTVEPVVTHTTLSYGL